MSYRIQQHFTQHDLNVSPTNLYKQIVIVFIYLIFEIDIVFCIYLGVCMRYLAVPDT